MIPMEQQHCIWRMVERVLEGILEWGALRGDMSTNRVASAKALVRFLEDWQLITLRSQGMGYSITTCYD